MRPPIRWAGSKHRLLPHLSRFWSGQDRYVEAFAGSACLFFNVEPKRALINDVNKELINAYRQLRDNPHRIYRQLIKVPATGVEYYRLRSLAPSDLSKEQRAVRFFFLNRYCFNGIYRTNNNGEFNVPYAKHGKTGRFPSLDHWIRCSDMLKRATFGSEDFETYLRKRVRAGDFVYLDPPYAVSNRRIFSQYSAQTFGLEDLERLGSLLEEINARGATFLVSYARSPESRLLEKNWHVRRVLTQRNVAGFSRHRRRAQEILISNISFNDTEANKYG